MPVAISIVKKGTSLNDLVWKKSQWIEIIKNIHGWGVSFIITEQFFIPWHFLVLNTYSEGCWECLIWLRCLWIYAEFLGDDVLWNISQSPLSLCLARRFSLYATHGIHQLFSWKKGLSHCQRCLVILSTLCPSTILSSGIWEDMWREKAI